jgi:hypothetical protein
MKDSAIKDLPEDDYRLTKCAKPGEIITTISSCLILPEAASQACWASCLSANLHYKTHSCQDG